MRHLAPQVESKFAKSSEEYPKTIENEIVIQIPENYTVGNIEHLNMIFYNEYVAFEASASIKKSTLYIRTKKSYNQTFFKKEDWRKRMSIMDKANTFYSSSIAFQKIKN